MCLEIISHLSQLTKKCISFCLLCLLTKETAIAYIEERYTGYQIKPVKVDEMCILHFFRDALDSIGIEVTVEEIKWILKIELSTNKDYGNFATAGVSISNKLQFFLNSSMTYYNADTADLLLFALGNFFDIDIAIFKSNERECWAEYLMKNNGCNRNTIHFVETLSSISLPWCLSPYKIHQWTIL